MARTFSKYPRLIALNEPNAIVVDVSEDNKHIIIKMA